MTVSDLPKQQQLDLINQWNQTAVNFPLDKCIHQLFEAQVEITPDIIAVIFEDEDLTYRELNEQANQLAHYLISLGVKPDTLVGLCIERSLEMVIGLLGILKAGAAYVPLDPSYPQERLAFMLKNAQAPVLLTQEYLLELFPSLTLQKICIDLDWEIIAQQSIVNPNTEVKASHLAYVIHTSGSTGQPKGIEIIHSAVVNFLMSMQQQPGLTEQDILLSVTTISFDIAVLELYLPLITGAQVTLVSHEIAADGLQLLDKLITSQATIMQATPATWHLLLAAGWEKSHCPALKILIGGEALSKELADKLLARSAVVWNMYGPTETTVWSTICEIGTYRQSAEIDTVQESIGRPIANTQVYVVDEQMQQVPIGAEGELYIGGAGLARGYLNLPELTEQKFVPNPFVDQPLSRLYKTGDLVCYLPDGQLEFLGRIDHQVKIRGFRIELGEIESKLHQHPDIRDAVVIAREDTPGEKKLVAYVVYQLTKKQRVQINSGYTIECQIQTDKQIQPVKVENVSYDGIGLSHLKGNYEQRQRIMVLLNFPDMSETIPIEGTIMWLDGNGKAGIQFDAQSTHYLALCQQFNAFFEQQGILQVWRNTFINQLEPFLQEALPDYMVPAHFVILDKLPLTPNGKVDRKALPPPDFIHQDLFTEIEKTLVKIWLEVLKLERVGLHDKFLRLGGDSLLATKIIVQVNELFQLALSPYILFEETPTVAKLAEQIEISLQEPTGLQLPPIEPLVERTYIPLSFPQQQLWLLSQFIPDIPVYNEPFTIYFKEAIDVKCLEDTLKQLLQRHESLRTTFAFDQAGQPVQIIAPFDESFTLPIQAFNKSTQEEQIAEYQQLVEQQAREIFDVMKGPLFRFKLVYLNQDDYRLCGTFHHLIFDGASLYNVFFSELASIYQALVAGQPAVLPELTVQYADYASWQRQQFTPENLKPQLNYWQKQLKDLPTLQLPTDRPRPAVQSYPGARYLIQLDKLSEKVSEYSQQQGVTIFMTLFAVFNILLYRYSGQDDIPVGTVTIGRNHAELNNLIGIFLNTLVLRTNLSGNPRVEELLQRIQKVTVEAYTNENLPFEWLVKALQIPRELNANPLFQVAFIFEPAVSEVTLNWELEDLNIDSGTAKFDLTMQLEQRDTDIIGFIEYNTDLFNEATIERMFGHYRTLLDSVITDSAQHLLDLPLLTQSEQQQLLNWNKSPLEMCLHQLFELQTELTPAAVAVVFDNQQLTYQALNQRANQLAHYLIELGLKPEQLVGICLEPSLEVIVAILAIFKAGGAYVPLDPAYPKERLKFMIKDAEVSIVLTQDPLRSSLPKRLTSIRLDSEWEDDIAKQATTNLANRATPDSLAYVIYTSGSTGKPKGVMLEHRGLCNLSMAQIQAFCIQSTSQVLQFASLNFDASIWEIVMALIPGATLHLASKAALLPGDPLLKTLQERAITIATLPPSVLVTLPVEQLSTLQTIIVAGEACSAELVAKYALGRRFFNAYGPTETTVCATIAECQDTHSKPPIGRPIRNTQLYVLDNSLQQLPIGLPGELYIGGIGLARGYINKPDLTHDKFIANPFTQEPAARLYKTGDLVRYQANGNLEFLGRIDYQVKIRGFRIELEEIEAVLMQHSRVQDAIVIAREDIPGDKRLVAYFTKQGQTKCGVSKLRDFLNEQLPNYMIPTVFVPLDSFPLTPNGKVDRKALPAPKKLQRETPSSVPQSELEQQIAEIWQDLLQLDDEVGIEETFFNLGGHSLLIVQLQKQLQAILEQPISINVLFQYPTIKEFVKYLNTEEQSTQPSTKSTVNQRREAILRQKVRKKL